MTNGGGGFGLAPSSGAEWGLCSPCGKAVLTGGQRGAVLGSPGAVARAGAQCWGGPGPPRGSARTELLVQGGCWVLLLQEQQSGTPGMVEQLGVLVVDLRCGGGSPAWGMGDCAAVQRCGAGHAANRAWGAGHSGSSSLRLFEEAISGRAGNSYHSLLTPGRQEGDPRPHRVRTASPPRPATGAHAHQDGHVSQAPCGTPEWGRGMPQGGGHPQRAPYPMGWLHPGPASMEGEDRDVPFTPTSESAFWGSPIPNPEQARSLRPHKPDFQSTPVVPGLCSGADPRPVPKPLRERVAGGAGVPSLSVPWSSACRLRVPAVPFNPGFVFLPGPL
ncbi:uncharacterized protein LOC129735894 [Falco cherrug]|uniref:uncharacterized protein LOC129735894 n=1 Tax=Falco cherrug TaxID=345164 RepID=UPI002479EA8E|nr:uncharacterized protein LOC129735894 [Falco cherrug]